MSLIFNSTANSLSVRMPVLKFDPMNQNQGRGFGPYFGLFLVNLLARMVAAKYSSYYPFQLSLESDPWLAYNKPIASSNHHSYYSQWHPIKNPYYTSYQSYPILTTAAPYSQNYPPDYVSDYRDYDYSATIQPQYVENLIPAESNNIPNIMNNEKKETTTYYLEKNVVTPTTTTKSTTTNSTNIVPSEEQIAEESNVKLRRQSVQKYKKRQPSRRDKYSPRRRKTTTPMPVYYDSYEEYTERYQPNKRRRPPYNRDSAELYYDDDEYYDSLETTTRYYKKQKRRTTKRPIKNSNRQDESIEIDIGTERYTPNTEIVIVRQAQTTTAPSTTQTSSVGTTTEPFTIITNTTIAGSTTVPSNETYGYGPSNGNEYVSFTYGPPIGKYQYQIPYFDWYTHEATKNSIVRRVQDIVNTDRHLK